MTISGIECLVAIASLCLRNADSILLKDSGSSARAVVHSKGYEVEILLRSDNIFTPDWSRMAEACANDVCISYYKHCTESKSATEIKCDYYFSQPGETQNTEVTITADDTNILKQAEIGVGVLARAGWIASVIDLSRFERQSDAASPPYCRRRVPQSACWPIPK